MTIAPVSADLLIKLALGAAAVGAVLYVAKRLASVLPPTSTFNPASDQNAAYKGVNAIGSALTGTRDFTLGGWIYDATHADPLLINSPAMLDNFGINGSTW